MKEGAAEGVKRGYSSCRSSFHRVLSYNPLSHQQRCRCYMAYTVALHLAAFVFYIWNPWHGWMPPLVLLRHLSSLQWRRGGRRC